MAESAPGGLVARVRAHPDALRAWVPVLGAALVLVAAFTDPAGWARLAVLVLPVALLALWAWWPRLPLPVLAIGVIVPVVVAQLTGGLEPSMFLVSLLAFIAGRWEDSRWQLGLACLAVVVTPVVVVLLQPANNRIAWQIWIIGITFPVVLGRIVRSQERLTRQLGEARRQLAIQAQAEARRRIARDIHDVVGQSLAGVLVQVASARHVLRRDVDGAEAALIAAETAGRRALGELRGTVSLLRSDEEAVGLPLPEFGRLGALVDSVRGNGLEVDYREHGDLDRVEPAVGVALYRIAQEALHNAMQHAPRAATSMVVTVTGSSVALQVDTIGRGAPPTDHDRPRYGLIGMRERAAAVGGTLHAGPTPQGWQVRCEVPRDPS
jgi:signal transduction histidine kinase